ncbi:MAG: tetratricopeptide repeat protein [Acidobacteria bacterium]|nr:tetratricopeptide repeat protein [Acidobacteriota bacterium]
MTYLQMGRLVAAEENLRRAAEAPVPVFQACLRLSEVQQKQGKLDAAIATLEAAHLKFPERPEATLQLAETLILAGKKDRARKYLEQIISNAPDSPWASQARTVLKGQ